MAPTSQPPSAKPVAAKPGPTTFEAEPYVKVETPLLPVGRGLPVQVYRSVSQRFVFKNLGPTDPNNVRIRVDWLASLRWPT
jgi:hypothetical protein